MNVASRPKPVNDLAAARLRGRQLPRYRNTPLGRRAPNKPFRDPLAEPSGLDFTVDAAGGASRPLLAVLDAEASDR